MEGRRERPEEAAGAVNARGLIQEAGFKGEVRYGESMSKHTSLGIGGPAEAMAYPETVKQLSDLVAAAAKEDVPVFYLGNGTNLLVLDGGIPGLVLNTGKLNWIELERGESGTSQVYAGAGVTLTKLISYTADAGLSGLEFAAGIPGTLGGAVAMNAGTKEAEMKDVLTSITLVGKDGAVSKAAASAISMKYRRAELPEGSVVAEASLAVIPWFKEEVKERIAANLRKRKAAQPSGVRSAGSTFKNPPGYSAWKLIDMAGLRATTVGRAQVSRMHTNFLINLGGATAREYKELIDLVTNTVKEKLNIILEPEIKIVGTEN